MPLCPCSGGPLPNTLPPAPQVKFYKPFGILLQCHFSSVAFPDMAPTPEGTNCFLFGVLCYHVLINLL